MNDKFDELAKGLAQSVTRRGALKKFGVALVMPVAFIFARLDANAGAAARWVPFPSMQWWRQGFALGALPDGRLIAAGGYGSFSFGSAETFIPATGSWVP